MIDGKHDSIADDIANQKKKRNLPKKKALIIDNSAIAEKILEAD